MFILYDLIFFIFGIIYLPYLVFKRKFHRGLYSRLGSLPLEPRLDKPIWIHAVSVGEIMSARSLIDALRKKYPFKKFAISTVTPTGNKIAKSIAGEGDFVFYLPLDISLAVKKVIRRINPSLFIIVETEIWPNLIYYLHKEGIPIVVVNGRISDRSFKGYQIISLLLKSILNKIDLFCVQTKIDSYRLTCLGVPADKIRITGNMKFDIADYANLRPDSTDKRAKMGLAPTDKLIVAGSTHPGEEEIILELYRKLLKDYTSLELLIAPRHPERAQVIERIVIRYGFNPIRISQLNGQTGRRADGQTVFILDTIGQLLYFYSIADIVFVGGSLTKIGGHNILEPATFQKPILFGPYMSNFRDIASAFLKDEAALLVRDANQLYKNICSLLNNPAKAKELGKRAKAIISRNQGSTQRNLEWIGYIFSGT